MVLGSSTETFDGTSVVMGANLEKINDSSSYCQLLTLLGQFDCRGCVIHLHNTPTHFIIQPRRTNLSIRVSLPGDHFVSSLAEKTFLQLQLDEHPQDRQSQPLLLPF